MCQKCVEVDEKIERYERLSSKVEDECMLVGIKELLERLKGEKAALHPPQRDSFVSTWTPEED
jgi:hypothetical protein